MVALVFIVAPDFTAFSMLSAMVSSLISAVDCIGFRLAWFHAVNKVIALLHFIALRRL